MKKIFTIAIIMVLGAALAGAEARPGKPLNPQPLPPVKIPNYAKPGGIHKLNPQPLPPG